MPRAGGSIVAPVKHHYQNYDTDVVSVTPPVQHEFYEVFHAQDVRLLWCYAFQESDDALPKNVNVQWTIDGNVYNEVVALNDGVPKWVYRSHHDLEQSTEERLAGCYTDVRGLDFKVEIKMTAAPGVNQTMLCECVRETLEPT